MTIRVIKNKLKNVLFKKDQITKTEFNYSLNINNVNRLANKTVLVTGGGGSIGSAICYRLAIEGARIGIAGRSFESLNNTKNQILKAGVPEDNLMIIIMDVTSDKSVEDGIESFVQKYNKLDVFINNAGGSARGITKELEFQDFDIVKDIVDLNLLGTMRGCKYSIKHLKRSKGKIINFGSTIGSNGQKNYSEYSASKSAIIGLTKSLALELGKCGITVNMITPGWVWRNAFDGNQIRPTELNALKRYGFPEEVANLVAFLSSNESDYITGNDFKIDGGRTLGLMGEK